MKRRCFIDALCRAGAALSLGANAQQAALPVIGFLNAAAPGPFAHLVARFREGLRDSGYIEGHNVAIEYRWAEGRYERLPELAGELVRRQVTVLVASGGENAPLAAKAATANIPVVFIIGGDPVDAGLVASLGRPGANLTGFSLYTGQLEQKRIGLIRELVPSAKAIAVLINPNFAIAPAQRKDAEDAARRVGVRLIVLSARAEGEFDAAFASLARQRAHALVVASDPLFLSRRERLVALAAQHKIPTIFQFREFADAGGLMSYGTNIAEGYRHIGVLTGRILKGARPADLPVEQPKSFELVINLKTAKALGLTIPRSVLLRADEVIR